MIVDSDGTDIVAARGLRKRNSAGAPYGSGFFTVAPNVVEGAVAVNDSTDDASPPCTMTAPHFDQPLGATR